MVIEGIDQKMKRMFSNNLLTAFAVTFAFLVTLLFSQVSLSASLETTADRTKIGSGETLQLTVRFDEQTSDDPEFSSLEHSFEILSRSKQNNYSIINGARTSYTEWRLQLLPKTTGKLLIPSLRFNGAISNAIEIHVEDQQVSSSSGQQPVFIETEIDKETLYVQEQLLLTLRIAHSVTLTGFSSEELTIDWGNIVKVDENDFYKIINGVRHRIIELKFALFAEQSGDFTIPSIRFKTSIPDNNRRFSSSFFDRGGKQIILRSEKKNISVKPRPQNSGNGEWLPSRGISISEQWSRSLDEVRAGEPITRTVYISAQGLAAPQIPPLAHPKGDGFKIYPDKAQLSDDTYNQGVIGTRAESIAIVPTQEGEITLPPLTLEWWDTQNNKLQTTVLEGRTLLIKPSDDLNKPTLTDPDDLESTLPKAEPDAETVAKNTTTPLIWILVATNLVTLLAFAWFFYRSRYSAPRKSKPTRSSPAFEKTNEAVLFKIVKKTAIEGQALPFRNAILNWAQAYWPKDNLQTLQEIALHTKQNDLANAFKALDQSLYSHSGVKTAITSEAGDSLSEGNRDLAIDTLADITEKLATLRQNGANSDQKTPQNSLRPLYENS